MLRFISCLIQPTRLNRKEHHILFKGQLLFSGLVRPDQTLYMTSDVTQLHKTKQNHSKLSLANLCRSDYEEFDVIKVCSRPGHSQYSDGEKIPHLPISNTHLTISSLHTFLKPCFILGAKNPKKTSDRISELSMKRKCSIKFSKHA